MTKFKSLLEPFTEDRANYLLYEKSDLTIREGFQAFILVKSLANLDEDFCLKYKTHLAELKKKNSFAIFSSAEQSGLEYYRQNCLSIEIVNSKDELQKVYFRKPPITNYLSDDTKESFNQEVNRDSSNEKI
jgi:inositol 1,4,5-triphosphate receptor type 3